MHLRETGQGRVLGVKRGDFLPFALFLLSYRCVFCATVTHGTSASSFLTRDWFQ